jgi:hypothetical protein
MWKAYTQFSRLELKPVSVAARQGLREVFHCAGHSLLSMVCPRRLKYCSSPHGGAESRIAKTMETLRSGRLPPFASSENNLLIESMHGTLCNGCREPIRAREQYYSIRLRDGSFMLLRFHPVCYELWMRF